MQIGGRQALHDGLDNVAAMSIEQEVAKGRLHLVPDELEVAWVTSFADSRLDEGAAVGSASKLKVVASLCGDVIEGDGLGGCGGRGMAVVVVVVAVVMAVVVVVASSVLAMARASHGVLTNGKCGWERGGGAIPGLRRRVGRDRGAVPLVAVLVVVLVVLFEAVGANVYGHCRAGVGVVHSLTRRGAWAAKAVVRRRRGEGAMDKGARVGIEVHAVARRGSAWRGVEAAGVAAPGLHSGGSARCRVVRHVAVSVVGHLLWNAVAVVSFVLVRGVSGHVLLVVIRVDVAVVVSFLLCVALSSVTMKVGSSFC